MTPGRSGSAGRLRFSLTAVSIGYAAVFWTITSAVAWQADAYAYWLADPSALYSRPVNTFGSYQYAPAFAQALTPITALPWPAFYAIWTGVQVVALAWIVGPLFVGAALLLPFVAEEVASGNVHLLLGAAIVLSLRHPAVWALLLLTKVTPGIGLLWYVVRREWRHLGVALVVTGSIVAGSFALDPGAWPAWIGYLVENRDAPALAGAVALPLAVRLPAAAALIAWGARNNRRWVLVVGTWLALPFLWPASFAMLVALRAVAVDREVEVRAAREGAPAPHDEQLGRPVADRERLEVVRP